MPALPPQQRRRRKGDPVGDPPTERPLADRNVLVWTTGPRGPEPRSATEMPPEPQAWPERDGRD